MIVMRTCGTQVCASDARPPRLVARAEPAPLSPVEVLVEEEMVSPVRVRLKFLAATEDRTAPVEAAPEDALEALGELLGDLEQVHPHAGTGGALDLERITAMPRNRSCRSARMMSPLIGIQIGPRQFEFPPNMDECDSAGS